MSTSRKLLITASFLASVGAMGCTRHAMIDALVSSAYTPDPVPRLALRSRPRAQLFAGDLHCHVAPPDEGWDVSRNLEETVALARRNGLRFVVLAPHVAAGFFADPIAREHVRINQRALRRHIDSLALTDVLLVPGFEYTDHEHGHLGLAFGDLDRVLDEVSVEDAAAHPERFFERWVASGGTIVVHHPLVTPLPGSVVPMARADISWRPWTRPEGLPPEIRAAHRLAIGFEAYNLAASALRDRYLLGNEGRTLIGTLARMDRAIVSDERRLVPLGGSDSHSHHLRATNFVIAESLNERSLRDALSMGRVCLRSPEACTFEASPNDGSWASIGASIRTSGPIRVRARGADARFVVDSRVVAEASSGEIASLSLPADRCSVLRADVGEGFSAPIYVNCPFAEHE